MADYLIEMGFASLICIAVGDFCLHLDWRQLIPSTALTD